MAFLFLLPLLATNFLQQSKFQDPEKVVQQVNQSVEAFRGNVALSGACRSGNPIDECWRCDPHWDRHRRRLADCAIGFGKNATGGRTGDIYIVTSSADDPVNPKPGTLRYGVIQDGPLWIIFESDMVIKLKQELMMSSFKTIDGRGANVHIADGPCRLGYFHVVNNDYTHWEMYAIGGSASPTINSQGNRFLAPNDQSSKQVTKRERSKENAWRKWNWRSDGDLLLNGAFFVQSGDKAETIYSRASSFSARPASEVALLTKTAGALNCTLGWFC
ncbi:hypothetical protein Droror1_Dr00012984 [Drosera rotundifolia]